MELPWRDVEIGGRTICTSITQEESHALLGLSTNAAMCLEVGSAFGYSARLLTHDSERYVVAVDPHEGYGSLGNSLSVMRSNVDESRVGIVQARSENFLPILDKLGAVFDFIFIDGDHRFDAVFRDLRWCWSMLSAWGTMAVHDYGEDTCPDVKRAISAWLHEVNVNVKTELLADTLFTVKLR